jgi:beta-lactam-binding protein with PASTA domain
MLGAAGFPATPQQQTVTNQSQNGIVLSQTPPASTQVKKGTSVTIVIGKYVAPTPTTTTSTTTPTTPTGTTSAPKKKK